MPLEPLLGQLIIFAGNFAPRGYAMCNGQILAISQNTALFSLLGTNFGGNGTSNFGLPDLRSAFPLGVGSGPGLTPRVVGETGGSPTVTVLQTEMPNHTHAVNASGALASQPSPAGNVWAAAGSRRGAVNLYSNTAGAVGMNPTAVSLTGGSLPHNNMHPYLALTFCIATTGIYPARN